MVRVVKEYDFSDGKYYYRVYNNGHAMAYYLWKWRAIRKAKQLAKINIEHNKEVFKIE
jgi:hypothetical protein